MIDACVLDASIGIKLFLEEEGSDLAASLFQGLTQDPPSGFMCLICSSSNAQISYGNILSSSSIHPKMPARTWWICVLWHCALSPLPT